jgi:hypothetical protein
MISPTTLACGIIVAQHRNLELACLGLIAAHALLHHQLAVVLGSQVNAGASSLRSCLC